MSKKLCADQPSSPAILEPLEFFRAVIATCLFLWLPASAFAYMILLNDNGNWAMGTLGVPDDERYALRACKNSRDRNADAHSEGSIALVCVTIRPHEKSATLGIWHTELLGHPGEALACEIALDDEKPIERNCKIEPSHFGNGQIVLSRDRKEIARILRHNNLAISLQNQLQKLPVLEFELDYERLQKVARPVLDFFQ